MKAIRVSNRLYLGLYNSLPTIVKVGSELHDAMFSVSAQDDRLAAHLNLISARFPMTNYVMFTDL